MVLEWVPVSACIYTYGYEVHTSTYAYREILHVSSHVLSCPGLTSKGFLTGCDQVFVSIYLFVFFAM